MSYTPTVWVNGDIITAEKLNKLENGLLSGGVFWITENEIAEDAYALDKTYAEIEEAILNGMMPFVKRVDGLVSPVVNYGYSGFYYIGCNVNYKSNSSTGVLQYFDVK